MSLNTFNTSGIIRISTAWGMACAARSLQHLRETRLPIAPAKGAVHVGHAVENSGNPRCDGKHTKSIRKAWFRVERNRTESNVQMALSKRHGEGCPPSCFSEDDPIYFEVPLQQLLDFSCAFFTFINRLVIGFLTVAQLPWVVDLKPKTTCWGQAQQRMQPSSDILPIMASAVHIFWAALEIRCQKLVPKPNT